MSGKAAELSALLTETAEPGESERIVEVPAEAVSQQDGSDVAEMSQEKGEEIAQTVNEESGSGDVNSRQAQDSEKRSKSPRCNLRSSNRPLLFPRACSWEMYNCYGQLIYCENVYVPLDLLMSTRMTGKLIGRHSRMIKGWELASGAQVRVFGSNPFFPLDRSGWYHDAPLHARIIALTPESRAFCARLIKQFLEGNWRKLTHEQRYQYWFATSKVSPPCTTSTQTENVTSRSSPGRADDRDGGSTSQLKGTPNDERESRDQKVIRLSSNILNFAKLFVETTPDPTGVLRNVPSHMWRLSNDVKRFIRHYCDSFANLKKMVEECHELQQVLDDGKSSPRLMALAEATKLVETMQAKFDTAKSVLRKRRSGGSGGGGDGQSPTKNITGWHTHALDGSGDHFNPLLTTPLINHPFRAWCFRTPSTSGRRTPQPPTSSSARPSSNVSAQSDGGAARNRAPRRRVRNKKKKSPASSTNATCASSVAAEDLETESHVNPTEVPVGGE